MSTLIRTLLLTAMAIAVVACGSHEPQLAVVEADVGPPTDAPTIAVTDNDFEPEEVVVEVGTEVTWEWDGESEHDVVGPGFESELKTTGTFTHTFDEPGSYTFICTPHRGMQGTVHVLG